MTASPFLQRDRRPGIEPVGSGTRGAASSAAATAPITASLKSTPLRLQGFRDFFDFGKAGWRIAMARLIGNAVPRSLKPSFRHSGNWSVWRRPLTKPDIPMTDPLLLLGTPAAGASDPCVRVHEGIAERTQPPCQL